MTRLSTKVTSTAALAGALLLLAACEGAVSDPGHGVPGDDDAPSATGGRSAGSGAASAQAGVGARPAGAGGGTTPGGGGAPSQGAASIPYVTRVARLTHKQYDNTVRDLLHLDAAPSAEFQPDPVFGGYDNNADELAVADRLGRDYRRAAEQLAERAVNDAAAYAKLVTCKPSSSGCASAFVKDFGKRAYRRPLTAEEEARFVALHGQGKELVASGDDFKDGVRLVIEAMLQSPKFLYRGELTKDAAGPSELALSSYEVAQRLSYMLWNTMPDERLFQAAEAGLTAPSAIAAEAARLLDDERAVAPVADFHFQWLQMSRFEDLTRDEELFPNFAPDLPLREEAQAFIRHVAFDLGRGYETLMSAPFTFVDSRLAKLYGLSGKFGVTLEKTNLDPNTRGGLLTQIGFLASHAYPSDTSPIHRGVFVHRRILCNAIPDPPPNVDTTLGAPANPKTTRESVEIQTSQQACTGCHGLINPPGFAFESYDAVGQLRTTDRGNPIDTSGQITIDGRTVEFSSAKELVNAIATSNDGRLCYARNLLRYAYGRGEAASDQPTLDALASDMASDEYGVKAALLALTQARSFRLRAPNQD